MCACNIIYNIHKECDFVMKEKKIGRPPSDAPKTYPLSLRLDEETENVLLEYSKKYGITRTEATREAIHRLGMTMDNYFYSREWWEKVKEYESDVQDNAQQFNKTVQNFLQLMQDISQQNKWRDLDENK